MKETRSNVLCTELSTPVSPDRRMMRAETTLPVLTPGMLPPPPFWQPGQRRIDITVVDIGHDPWRVSAHPLAGAGAWLRPGTPSPRPILVVRPSIPALVHAEQVLARLEPWVALGAADAPGRLVVTGARHWPREVPGTAGHRLQPLVADAVIPRNGRINCAQLKLIPARAAISPMMLSQATNQPEAGPPSAAAQWYMAPDVG